MKLLKILLPLFAVLLVACQNVEYYTFDNKEEAEQKIGEFKTPVMPRGYTINKITYKNDGFTHPITKVFYERGSHSISFMIASSRFDQDPSKKIKIDGMTDTVWITKDKEYILKWRKTNKQSYKYLFTKNIDDKEWFVSVAKNF
ncbi:hypothetical protein N780_01845 [Pontibacillus chungwhensis BH030062]|uniref:DUF4367 domain-containing protein n=1 Tax=Pontibacillus chungwhensis BH030062 TaxID=1385513 RepID=A0A0A2V066_9BACI|nr:hypothetical protein [Pontibacillus chungwhensis]KGP92393.1 hypothetical protein N780_01845 [Pontibacillus chungwhensis BH030062]